LVSGLQEVRALWIEVMQPCVDFLKNQGLLFHNDCATLSRGSFFMARERFQEKVRMPLDCDGNELRA
jgi:hypothetical protein